MVTKVSKENNVLVMFSAMIHLQDCPNSHLLRRPSHLCTHTCHPRTPTPLVWEIGRRLVSFWAQRQAHNVWFAYNQDLTHCKHYKIAFDLWITRSSCYSKVLNRTNCQNFASTGPDWAWVDEIWISLNETSSSVNEKSPWPDRIQKSSSFYLAPSCI